jgi:hypothetical protein
MDLITEVIAFYSPFNASEVSPSRVIVSVTIYSQNVSLPEYTEFVVTRAINAEQYGIANQTDQTFGLTQSELSSIKVDLKSHSEVTLAGHSGHNMFTTITGAPTQNSTLTLNQMSTWTAIDNKVYSVLYQAEGSSFSQHLPEVNRMLESLAIENG